MLSRWLEQREIGGHAAACAKKSPHVREVYSGMRLWVDMTTGFTEIVKLRVLVSWLCTFYLIHHLRQKADLRTPRAVGRAKPRPA